MRKAPIRYRGYQSCELVWVDMEPLLRAERVRCEEVASDLETSQRELNHFREVIEPAYSSWFYSHFGEKVTRIRELESRSEAAAETKIGVRVSTDGRLASQLQKLRCVLKALFCELRPT
jgi:hypothetical protein